MNRSKLEGFIATMVYGHDEFMEMYEKSEIGSHASSRMFLKALAMKEAGEVATKVYEALPSGTSEEDAWKACQGALKSLVDTADHSMHARAYEEGNPEIFSPELQAYIDDTQNTILGYELALACIHNYK